MDGSRRARLSDGRNEFPEQVGIVAYQFESYGLGRYSLKASPLGWRLALGGFPSHDWPMDQLFVMTIIGSDRPGLVEKVAETVAKHGGNWLESRMCRLGGEFAGILRVSVPDTALVALETDLRQLESNGLTLTLRMDQPLQEEPLPRTFTVMELIGHDRPGIVREISKVLADSAINVEELQTSCESAPMSGEMLFKATARLRVPAAIDMSKVRRQLEQIAADMVIDISLSEHSRI